jgi:hypothetical protein
MVDVDFEHRRFFSTGGGPVELRTTSVGSTAWLTTSVRDRPIRSSSISNAILPISARG